MDYFKQRRAYRNFKMYEVSISNGQNNLYRELLDYANDESKLDGYFRMKNSALAGLTGLSEAGIKKARNELVQSGLIEYRKGRKNVSAPEYKIVNLYDKKKSMDTSWATLTEKSSSTGTDKVAQLVPQPVSQPVAHKNLTNTDLYRTTTQQRSLGVGESVPNSLPLDETLLDFTDWWEVYPRHEKKQAASLEYNQARNSGATVEQLLEGARNYAEFVKVQGKVGNRIAMADNWLKGERWTDTYDLTPPNAKETLPDWAKESWVPPEPDKSENKDLPSFDEILKGD